MKIRKFAVAVLAAAASAGRAMLESLGTIRFALYEGYVGAYAEFHRLDYSSKVPEPTR
jgi:hypothetical protein